MNEKNLCTAGTGGDGVFSAILTWASGSRPAAKSKRDELKLHVGGLLSRANEFVDWVARKLSIGDEVRVRIVEKNKVDKPKTRRRRKSPAQQLKEQKAYVRRTAKQFGWKIKSR